MAPPSTKPRFQSKSGKVLSPATSKAGTKNASVAGSDTQGAASKTRGGVPQVFHNGKILTPQALLTKTNLWRPQEESSHMSIPKLGERKDLQVMPEKKLINRGKLGTGLSSFHASHPGMGAALAKSRDANVVIEVEESFTTTIFSLPSMTFPNDTRETKDMEERNKKYEECQSAHLNLDGYGNKHSQTLNNSTKNANEMAAPTTTSEMGTSVTQFEITDLTTNKEVVDADTLLTTDMKQDALESAGLSAHVKKFVVDTTNVALATPGCLLDTTGTHKPIGPGEGVKKDKKKHAGTGTSASRTGFSGGTSFVVGDSRGSFHDGSSKSNQVNQEEASSALDGAGKASHASSADSSTDGNAVGLDPELLLMNKQAQVILQQHSLLKKIELMERAVQQNIFHERHLDYRALPKVQPIELAAAQLDASQQGTARSEGFGFGIGAVPVVEQNTTDDADQDQEHNTSGDEEDDADNAEELVEAALQAEYRSRCERLFTFHSPGIVKDRAVTGICWNAISTDLLAVAYGQVDYSIDNIFGGQHAGNKGSEHQHQHQHHHVHANGEDTARTTDSQVDTAPNTARSAMPLPSGTHPHAHEGGHHGRKGNGKGAHRSGGGGDGEPKDEDKGGLVLFWSLRNPIQPERVLRTEHAVTSLDFSKSNPMILAVGCYNGDVLVYDLGRSTDFEKPKESSANIAGGHIDPVWQVRWVVRGSKETLVSISSDGSVLEWVLKKGLSVSTLMLMLRGSLGQGWVSRKAAGHCLDFIENDPNSYMVGTEDGTLHLCSVSYNEQYLRTFEGHRGPVYRIRCSKHWPELFVSCSADWTIGIFHTAMDRALLTLRSTGMTAAVNDIALSESNSLLLASVTGRGRLQIWDLAHSAIEPVISLNTTEDTKREVLEPELFESALNTARTSSTDILDEPLLDAHGVPLPAVPGAAATGLPSMLGFRQADKPDPILSPVHTLLRNLARARDPDDTGEDPGNATLHKKDRKKPVKKERCLTTVAFGQKSPTVVVGDSLGIVTMYRLRQFVVDSNEGPVQQTNKLKNAIFAQTDPADIAVLQAAVNNK